MIAAGGPQCALPGCNYCCAPKGSNANDPNGEFHNHCGLTHRDASLEEAAQNEATQGGQGDESDHDGADEDKQGGIMRGIGMCDAKPCLIYPKPESDGKERTPNRMEAAMNLEVAKAPKGGKQRMGIDSGASLGQRTQRLSCVRHAG